MAVSSGTVAGSYIGTTIVEDATANSTVEDAKASGGNLYQVYINNGHNAQVYVKCWQVASGSVTLGSTAPALIFPCPASVSRQYNFPDGLAFSTALSFACVDSPGTAGTTSPGSTVLVRITHG